MGLYDRMTAEANARRCRGCLVREFYRGLGAEDRRDFRRALADPTISNEAFLAVLKERGYRGNSSTLIHRHRHRRRALCAADGAEEIGRAHDAGRREARD